MKSGALSRVTLRDFIVLHSLGRAYQGQVRGAIVLHGSPELRYWSARSASARVIPDPTDNMEIRFGSAGSIRRADGRRPTRSGDPGHSLSLRIGRAPSSLVQPA
jgi:hypothetical protein